MNLEMGLSDSIIQDCASQYLQYICPKLQVSSQVVAVDSVEFSDTSDYTTY